MTNIKYNPFSKAMEQRDIKISNIEYKHANECPKDCELLKEHILVQLRVCEDQCENNSRYKKVMITNKLVITYTEDEVKTLIKLAFDNVGYDITINTYPDGTTSSVEGIDKWFNKNKKINT